jgi:hypothetical protein
MLTAAVRKIKGFTKGRSGLSVGKFLRVAGKP